MIRKEEVTYNEGPEGEKIKIFITEDHPVVRKGLRALIEVQNDMVVVGEAGDGETTLNFLKSGLPANIVITDLNMPIMDGFSLISSIRETCPNIKTIALSMLTGEKQLDWVFASGCAGYLTKSVESDELLFAIRQVAAGKRYVCSEMIDKILLGRPLSSPDLTSQAEIPVLSERELEILDLIAKGMTNTEIADKVFLSRRTVEGHRQNLIDRTGSKNTAALVRYAVLNRLVN